MLAPLLRGSFDPLGYGIACIIVALLGNLVLQSIVPVCGEILWIDLFSLVNTFFCGLALVQSGVCIMIESNTSETILPAWIPALTQHTFEYLSQLVGRTRAVKTGVASATRADTSSNVAQAVEDSRLFSDAPKESMARLLHQELLYSKAAKGSGSAKGGGEEESDSRKLLYFESLFFALDTDAMGAIGKDDCTKLLTFALLDDNTAADLDAIFRAYDSNGDHSLKRLEFCALCKDVLWHLPQRHLDLAVHTFTEASVARKKQIKAYWHSVSHLIDHVSRVVIPLIYLFALLVLFNIEMGDTYGVRGVTMITGFGSMRITESGVVILLTYVVAVVACGGAARLYFVIRREQRRMALEKAAMRSDAERGSQMDAERLAFLADLDPRAPPASLPVGVLRTFVVPPFSIAKCDLMRGVQLAPVRFDNEDDCAALPLQVIGPAALVAPFENVGIHRSALVLATSPKSVVNLPMQDRLTAGIPIAASRFAYVHPATATAGLSSAQRAALISGDTEAGQIELILNGGYAYIDLAGLLISMNAITSTAPSAVPHFSLFGPLPLPVLVHETLSQSARFHPVTAAGMPTNSARQVAWVRPSEFPRTGIRASYGAFVYSSDERDECAVFQLVPVNVPQAKLTVVRARTGAPVEGATELSAPLSTTMIEVKRCIEALTGTPAHKQALRAIEQHATRKVASQQATGVQRQKAAESSTAPDIIVSNDMSSLDECGIADGQLMVLEVELLIDEVGDAALPHSIDNVEANGRTSTSHSEESGRLAIAVPSAKSGAGKAHVVEAKAATATAQAGVATDAAPKEARGVVDAVLLNA